MKHAAAPPIEVDAGGQPPLGMAPGLFLRDYWQKRPLLLRNAFPGFIAPLQPEDLAGLACEELALSRLVQYERGSDRWVLRSGPFEEHVFPALPTRDWTLLVQDVDKWDADVQALLQHFGFLPSWRVDDVMVSFAAPGGSVGAHVDQYDVFLLQVEGRRRWRIGRETGLRALNRDTMLRFYRNYYRPGNTILSIVGDVAVDVAHGVRAGGGRDFRRAVGGVVVADDDFSSPAERIESRAGGFNRGERFSDELLLIKGGDDDGRLIRRRPLRPNPRWRQPAQARPSRSATARFPSRACAR